METLKVNHLKIDTHRANLIVSGKNVKHFIFMYHTELAMMLVKLSMQRSNLPNSRGTNAKLFTGICGNHENFMSTDNTFQT